MSELLFTDVLPGMPEGAVMTAEEVRAAYEALSTKDLIEYARGLGHAVESGEVATDAFMDDLDLVLQIIQERTTPPDTLEQYVSSDESKETVILGRN